jgi:mono/diheme cytochrome c family protein
LLFTSACGGNDTGDSNDDVADDTDTGEMVDGREYFDGELSAALGAAGNQARCSTCHSADGTLAGFSGESMQDIAFKEGFKGGDAPDLLSAVNACVTGWMGGTALTAEDAEYVALAGYLESISDPSATTPNELAPEVLADEAEYEAAYAGGDPAAGAAKYDANCAVCHDAALTVNLTAAYPKATIGAYTIGRLAQKVRTSGPPPSGTADATDTTPGPMPFFEPEELSATDLADIIAHLKG